MQRYSYMVADVFTDTPLQGNPVAVFLDATGLSTERMQLIANEMHLSETVFVFPPSDDCDVHVRIFTPVNELPFAGHPTLGAAIALGESWVGDRIRMQTAMGLVPFDLERDTKGCVRAARMQQPIPTWEPYDRAEDLLAALGLANSSVPVLVYNNGPRHVFIGLESEYALTKLRPDHRRLGELPDMAANCFAGYGDSWRLRMFSPAYGVVEDAATGSAAGSLAVHLARFGLAPFGQEIKIVQGVEIGRPSTMRATAIGAGNQIEGVEVAGSAMIVIRGTLDV